MLSLNWSPLSYRSKSMDVTSSAYKKSSENVIKREGPSNQETSCDSHIHGPSLRVISVHGTLRTDLLLRLGSLVPGGASEVGVVEEKGEEDQVAEVHEEAPGDVVHVGGTAHLVLPVVHQAQHGEAHHHLQDLGGGDDHGAGAGHPPSGGPGSVVRVHEGVDHEVHGHEPAAARHLVLVGVPGVEQHGDVVVPVQEDEALLPQDDEHRVSWERKTSNAFIKGIFHLIFVT